ncbi:MAG: diguanylate cyclase [Holophagaceae bacterium]|nr:diguanylate cyclase [Holophagaceae bacterium]
MVRSLQTLQLYLINVFAALLVMLMVPAAAFHCVAADAAETAPPGRYAFRTYNAEQGLTSLAITQLNQDAQGFLWVGTEDGLFRYDGSRFQAYSLKQGLPSSQITAIHQDPQGVLWVGTFGGLARKDGQAFQAIPGVQDVQALATGPDGKLWVATTQGPFSLSGKPSRPELLPSPGWPGGEASALYSKVSGGAVWAARWTLKNGRPLAEVLRWKDGIWKRFGTPSNFGQERIDALLADWDGRIWARSSGHLWVLPTGTDQFIEPKSDLPSIRSRGYLAASRDGGVWVTTDQGLYHIHDGQWRHLGAAEGLPTAWTRTMHEDREGNLWFSSLGLYRLLGLEAWQSHAVKDGLPSELVWTIRRDNLGQLLVGTDQGAARATAKGWSLIPGTAKNAIRSLVEGPDGILYMGGAPTEVLAFNPATRQTDRFGAAEGVMGKRIFRLLLDPEGSLWVATEGAGLLRGRREGRRWSFKPEALPGGDAQEYVSDLHLDSRGRLFAAGAKGLAVRAEGRWRRITVSDGLRRNHVSYVSGTRNGDLLIAYFDPLGFTRARLEGGHFRVLGHEDTSTSLASDKVYSMGEDALGRIWAGTARGVDILSANGTEHFGLQDGLIGEDCDAQAFHADGDGGVWIGTSAGLSHYLPKGGQAANPPPPTVILGFKLGGKTFSGTPAASLEVDRAHNDFEARFAGLSFAREDAVQQEVRLVGLEDRWRPTDSRVVRYPSLPKGSYRFEVRSRIGAGPWGEAQKIGFKVLPAWWETWWFRVVGALAVLGLGSWVVLGYKTREESRRKVLEALVLERTRDLENANRALQDQTITDPLTGLRNRRFLQFQMPEEAAQAQRRHRLLSISRAERLDLNIDLLFLMVDIDHFKEVNDLFGHAAGDRVLGQVAQALQACIRDTDAAVRWGGEEFLVLARNTSRRESTILVERIRSAVALHPFDVGEGRILHRTCSIGYTCFPFIPEQPASLDWERVVEIADQCLYAAKQGGRDAWVGVYPSDDAPAGHLIEMLRIGSLKPLAEDGSLVVKSSMRGTEQLDWKDAPNYQMGVRVDG